MVILSYLVANGLIMTKSFVSTAWSGWGKVSAARATVRLLSKN